MQDGLMNLSLGPLSSHLVLTRVIPSLWEKSELSFGRREDEKDVTY